MIRWSIPVGQNVFLIPVLPSRISFAILVRRALSEIEGQETEIGGVLGGSDTILLSLPAVVERIYLEAVDNLPSASVLFLQRNIQSGPDHREILSVNPVEGFTEAARSATERRCPIVFADAPIDPASLLRDCSKGFPPIFDDGAVLVAGVSSFLEVYSSFLARPPVRVEPQDSLRVTAVASAIQRLAPTSRRVVAFCSASIVLDVQATLGIPTAQDDDAIPFKSSSYTATRFTAAEGDMLSSMDDFPYYAQFYEQTRSNVQDLSKLQFVERCLSQILTQGKDVKVSIRRHSILATFIEALCRSSGRCTPTRAEVVAALTGSLHQDQLKHVLERLLSYGEELELRVVSSNRRGLEIISKRRQAELSTLQTLVRRDCLPTQPLPIPIRFVERGGKIDPPSSGLFRGTAREDYHVARLEGVRRRALQAALLAGTGTNSSQFRGSLERGIDVRRSVRSILGGGNLFVRKVSKGLLPKDIVTAPIVWILHAVPNASFSSVPTNIIGYVNKEGKDKVELLRHQIASSSTKTLHDISVPDHNVGYAIVAGRLQFLPLVGEVSVDYFRGQDVDRRLPDHADMIHPEGVGCLDPKLQDAVKSSRWDELFFLTASLYASNCVVTVCPSSYRLSGTALRAISGRRQKLLRIDLERIEPEELLWLSRKPIIQKHNENIPDMPDEIWDKTVRAIEARW